MQRLRRTLEVAAWAAFFALAAAVLVLRYAVLPHIERLRPEIVERVSAIVGHRVTIGGIEAQWLGLRPQVNLTDVRIYDAEGREALVLPSVENILSWRSLAHGTLSLYALHIDGPRLVVRRDSAGGLSVAGFRLVATPGEPGLSDWLSAQRDIEVRNAELEWRDELRAAPPLDFDVAWQPAGGVLSASALELAPLAHLGEALPLPAEFRLATQELAPR
ncbi:MAG TPA: DUF3971 domain-containing protein, partial [Burkholderiales bacterium]|nr:DUF3971 domain-containing protein [Burkholderiales bacterium]